MDGGSLASLVNFLVSGVKPGIANIVHDGVVEQDRALRDNADLGTQAMKVDTCDVLAVNPNESSRHVVESIKKLQDSALAGAGLSNEAKETPCGQQATL